MVNQINLLNILKVAKNVMLIEVSRGQNIYVSLCPGLVVKVLGTAVI